jgi:20S proteasome alpha/beta subunit
MTIAAGFHCADGVVLCADSEVTDEVTKYHREKIFSHDEFLLATGAGATDYIKMAFDKLSEKFSLQRPSDPMRARQAVEETVLDVYEHHIGPYFEKLDNPGITLLVAVRTLDGKVALIKTMHTAAFLVERYECIGIGLHLAEYWASLLYSPDLSAELMSCLCLFIVREVKRHVPGCGGETHVMTLSSDPDARIASRLWDEDKILAGFPESVVPILVECRNLKVNDVNFQKRIDSFVEKVRAIRESETKSPERPSPGSGGGEESGDA